MKHFLVRADNVKSVLRGAGLVFIISTVGAVLGYLVQMLLARWLGSTDFGAYRYALTWCALLAGFALLGFNASGARFISQYIQQESPQKLKGFLIGSTALVLAAAVLITALGIGFVLLFPKASESLYAGPMIIALIGVPGLALLNLQKNNLRAFRWALVAEIPRTRQSIRAQHLGLVAHGQQTLPRLQHHGFHAAPLFTDKTARNLDHVQRF